MVQQIGYPKKSPGISDPVALQRYYAPVNISESGYFNNVLSMVKASVTREWAKAGKATDRNEWGMTASTVNV